MKITADFTKHTGAMKPMHGIGQPPMLGPHGTEMMHYIEEAGIPYSRLSDVQWFAPGQHYVDIPSIFPNFDADENLPESYDFAFTDALISHLVEYHCEPFYRLGVTIENFHTIKAYHVDPPKDFGKWARICEHIVRHYNEGWADGFHWGITYWEVWNEPADDAYYPGGLAEMWHGTQQQYYELYATTAKHLKSCFGDSIKVGGYGSGGFHDFNQHDPELKGIDHMPENRYQGFFKFGHEFLAYIREQGAPLDFFSWHSYRTNPLGQCSSESGYVRRLLTKYGYGDVPDFMNEWNPCCSRHPRMRGTTWASSRVFATMVQMQRTQTSMLNYYDACLTPTRYCGMFNPDTHEPYLAYYAFRMFNDAYQLKNEVFTTCEDEEHYPLCGASDGKKHVLLFANSLDTPVTIELELIGVSVEDAEIILLNNEFRYSNSGWKIKDGKLDIPPETCVEIRFFSI